MDEDISRWVLEFLLRHSTSDLLINKILMKLPISNNNSRLKKTILLRSIETEILNGSVSEMVLDSLKAIEVLDKKEGIRISSSMREAYCAVAVECTLKYLGGSIDNHNKSLEAIKRIWRDEIENLEGSELVTAELLKWKEDIEVAIGDEKMCSKLLKKNTQRAALRLVKKYLGEAWAIMGPTFLELAVAKMKQLKEKKHGGGGGGECTVGKQKGIQKENVLLRHKRVASHRRVRGPVKITDNEESGTDASGGKYETMPTPEINKEQEVLESSSLEVQEFPKDPQPDMLHRAAAVLAVLARKNQNHEPPVEKQNNVDEDVSNPSANVTAGPVQAKESNNRNKTYGQHNDVPKPSLMEQNHTACTYEWDDLTDDSPGGQSEHLKRFHLPTPKRKAVSPLKETKLARRRKVKRWSLEEEEALRKGVQKFGKGNWKLILKSNPEAFEERTEVDLKDKWRNMMRY